MLVFFEDILIYNRMWEEHLQHIEEVLHILEGQHLYAKLSKCEFRGNIYMRSCQSVSLG